MIGLFMFALEKGGSLKLGEIDKRVKDRSKLIKLKQCSRSLCSFFLLKRKGTGDKIK